MEDFRQRDRPFVIKKRIDSWKCRFWHPEEWATFFGDKKVKFRLGKLRLESKGPQWENDCKHEGGPLSDFVQWLTWKCRIEKEDEEELPENKLMCYSPDEYWGYADYIHLGQIFDSDELDKENLVDWSCVGEDNQKTSDSTLWIGTQGANTPCHQDSYGYNFVAQLYGRKKWILFDPEESISLYPTRIPYEESSVFSQVDILNPDLQSFPRFRKSSPFTVVLEPGDVLYVPHHYWHFVEALETSISINTWVKMESDSECRLKESITRAIISEFIRNSRQQSWLNPTEELSTTVANLKLIKQSMGRLKQKISESQRHFVERIPQEPTFKSGQLMSDPNIHILRSQRFDHVFKAYSYPNSTDALSSSETPSDEDILRCFTDPEVVALISRKLCEQYQT